MQEPEQPKARTKDEGMLSSSFTLMKVRGIRIGAHWSWLFVFALVAWSLSTALFPRAYPGLSDTTYLVMGAIAAVAFFGSILLHELGHAFRALREGMQIGDITLWLFGGVAKFRGMFPSAGAEFRIAIAGPLVSVALAAAFWGAGALARSAELPVAAVGVLEYLGRINAIVVAFNMVPALPLDGGRVLRSWLWHRQRSFTAATISAAKAGKAFAYLLITIGILGFFTQTVTGGVWFVFLGWFLLQAAQAEASFVFLRQAFRDVAVRDLMSTDVITVDPAITITQFLEDVARRHGHSTYPVVSDGQPRGLMSLRLAAQVPSPERDSTTVSDVMLHLDRTPVIDPDTPMMEAIETIQGGPGRALVMDEDRLVGLLSISDAVKALEIERVRGPLSEPGVRKAGAWVWVLVASVLLLAASAFYNPPFAIVTPAPAERIDDDIVIEGVPVDDLDGSYHLVAVAISRGNTLMTIWAVMHPDRDVIPVAALIPEGVSEQDFLAQQREIFRESQQLAAAAAAQAAGMQVDLSGSGALVQGVLPGSPADGELREGDVIVAIDSHPVTLASDLRRATTTAPAGTRFTLTIERGGTERTVEVNSKRIESQSGTVVGIGVFVSTRDFEIDLPFTVEFRDLNVGGPSAGLAYALAIYDLIHPANTAAGRAIAASGTVQVDGSVGAVGGLKQKAIAAERAGAAILIVPEEEIGVASGAGITVRGAGSVAEAIALLSPS